MHVSVPNRMPGIKFIDFASFGGSFSTRSPRIAAPSCQNFGTKSGLYLQISFAKMWWVHSRLKMLEATLWS